MDFSSSALLHYFTNFSLSSTKEVTYVISNINKKDFLLDPVSVGLLSIFSNIIFPVLQSIVNKSFEEACFPDQLKYVVITSIIENYALDPEIIKNNWSISNTPFLAKVLEKAAFQQFYDYLNSNCLLSPNQSGYKQNQFLETALFSIVNDLQVVIHNDNLAAVVMLDLSGAFDTDDHQRLLFKLKHYFDINGNVLKWLTSYLNDRISAIVINNICSIKNSLLFGVPQGSILGPLFIMYINELTNSGSEFDITIHSYADNTTLYIGFCPEDGLQNAIENIKYY